ncbi:hypothetical protein VPNG_08006 [Cytospora leucostoma]|uniref:Uncharacterized protein n=1 Tax=Cytospora leucostoma TaxID=1230097 RepID=A0A423WR72_9PEZI|nr:hypothetical protein VPNG_08006 [Cytospora leucostoma]
MSVLQSRRSSSMFRGDEVLLVDMEDTIIVRRVASLLCGDARTRWKNYRKRSAMEGMMKTHRRAYETALPNLQRALIIGRAERNVGLRAGFEGEDGLLNTDIDWVREALDSFDFRSGMLFVKDHAPAAHPDCIEVTSWDALTGSEFLMFLLALMIILDR